MQRFLSACFLLMNLILEEEETTERGQALSGIVEKLEIGKEQRPKVPVSLKSYCQQCSLMPKNLQQIY